MIRLKDLLDRSMLAIKAYRRSRVIYPVKRFQQLTGHSCVASVLQSVYHYFTSKTITHKKAILLVNCNPDGANFDAVPKALRKHLAVPCISRSIALKQIKNALRHGVVIACDKVTYAEPHAVMVVGYNDDGWWVLDPHTPFRTFRSNKEFRKGYGEFMSIKTVG